MRRSMIIVSVLLSLIISSYTQFPGSNRRYRNPRITYYFNYRCRGISCTGFEEVCELRPLPCFVQPCLLRRPTCVPTSGSSTKSGRCSPPWFVTAHYPQCNTDYGCYGDDVCCHGFFGSRCMSPIPDFTIG